MCVVSVMTQIVSIVINAFQKFNTQIQKTVFFSIIVCNNHRKFYTKDNLISIMRRKNNKEQHTNQKNKIKQSNIFQSILMVHQLYYTTKIMVNLKRHMSCRDNWKWLKMAVHELNLHIYIVLLATNYSHVQKKKHRSIIVII